MKKTTRIQRVTLALILGAIAWEIAVWIWSQTLPPHDPLIRADLIVIIPVLVVFITLSIVQFTRRKKFLLLLLISLSLLSCKKFNKRDGVENSGIEGSGAEKSLIDSTLIDTSVRSSQILRTKTGKTFHIETRATENGLMEIVIRPEGFENSEESWNLSDMDPLLEAFTTDLDGNGFEELYLITLSAGSGSYGKIVGFASNRDLSLTPIYVPDPVEKDFKTDGALFGYMGHDSIYLDQGKLLRKFPVYKEGDPNCCPTGGQRTLQYELVAGEAGWILRIASFSNL